MYGIFLINLFNKSSYKDMIIKIINERKKGEYNGDNQTKQFN